MLMSQGDCFDRTDHWSAQELDETAFKDGRLRHHALCGILMHSSLAVTTEGLPLGLSAVKFWNQDKFKGTASLEAQNQSDARSY